MNATLHTNNSLRFLLASFGIIGLLLLIGNSAAYIFQAFQKFPQADDYRLTLIHIKPWFEGTWTFETLWDDVHPNPIHGIVLILSSALENMRFDSLPYLVIVAVCCKWLGYTLAFKMAARLDIWDSILVAFGVGLVIFSFNSTVQYQWNSVGIAQVYHAVGAFYLVALVRFSSNNDTPSAIVLFLVALVFQIISRQYALPWMIASSLVFVLGLFSSQNKTKERCLKIILIIAAVILLEKFFHRLIELEPIYEVRGSLIVSIFDSWGDRPLELFKHLLISITSSAVNTSYLSQSGFSEEQILAVSIGYNLILLCAIAICLANVTKPPFQLALVMMLFMLLTIAGSVVYRSSSSTQWLQGYVPRYVSFRDVGAVGILLTFICLALKQSGKRVSRLIAGLLVVGLCYLNIQFARYSWNYLPYLEKYRNNVVAELQFIGNQLDQSPAPDPASIRNLYLQTTGKALGLGLESPALDIIGFWKINKLNVFSYLPTK